MGFQFVQVNGVTPSVAAWSMIGNQANRYTYTGGNQRKCCSVSR
jgi:hypothetical protein